MTHSHVMMDRFRAAFRPSMASIAICVLAMAGCKKETTPAPQTPSQSAAPSATSPATSPTIEAAAGNGAAPQDVPALLNAGGTHWSSHDDGTFNGKAIKGGKDYWIWPADDATYSPKDLANGRALVVKLNYRLRPGGRPVTGGTVYATVDSAAPEAGTFLNIRTAINDFSATAESGSMTVQFSPWKVTGAREVTVYLNRPGDPALLSNIVRLKVAGP